MSASSDRLYNLLPVLYRLRDADQGQALRALLAVIDGSLAGVEADIAGLYDNWFIETADEWVVPYIGDLLGVRGLNTIPSPAFSQRSYVANTLFYRRRKGTASVLGRLAADVTGWAAQAVELFERLQTTQYMNHVRLNNITPNLRDVNALNLLGSPFESSAHTADVRHISDRRGKYNIPNIGLFLWRLQNYPLEQVVARQAAAPHAYGYHFSPLGNPAPLFGFPGQAGFPPEQTVPAPIRPYDFFQDLQAYAGLTDPPGNSRYYGPARSLQVVKDGSPVPPGSILCKDLRGWDRPPAGRVAVDVSLGRLTFAPGEEPNGGVIVSYNYGFSADLGGGPYDRRERIPSVQFPVIEFPVGPGKTYADLAAAQAAWNVARPPAVWRIYDSSDYDASLSIDLPDGGALTIDCENGQRPTLRNAVPLTVRSSAASSALTPAFSLAGLVVEGSLQIGGRISLTLADCTLVPGGALDEDGDPVNPNTASLTAVSLDGQGLDLADTLVTVSRCILGPLELPDGLQGLTVSDSILDAPLPKGAVVPSRSALAGDAAAGLAGPVTSLDRVTVFGSVRVRELSLASNCIFVQPVIAERRQVGCVRFSYIPDGSATPRRFRCQPDLAIAARKQQLDPVALPLAEQTAIENRLVPQFTALGYGLPAFAQLGAACADELKTGAEDGSEMGAFSLLQQPQRLQNLQVALGEYLRFGLEAGIFFVT